VGSGNALSLNSGTAALHIALVLAGVRTGDEVISTALTAEPTNVAIKMSGARVRYADVDYRTGNISPTSIEANINDRTRAIVVVDYAGTPVDVASIRAIADRQRLPVVHDAAHALGATFRGVRCGGHFPYTAFSLQAIKHITTVDGGVLQVADPEAYDRGKLIRWFGLDKKKARLDNNIQVQGFKYHMNNVNATIGIVQLRHVEWVVSRHVENGRYFDRELRGVAGVELLEYCPDSQPAYWLFTAKVEDRAGFVRRLGEDGIMASELHKRSDSHEFLRDFPAVLPELDRFYERLVHIPCGWWVTDEDRGRIADVIRRGW
jgi:dTDP-4-amino-4,6-dideoxygalactose transaminase